MKVLVTGGGGYLGSVLVRELIDARHAIHVLDRFSWGTQPLLSAVGKAQNKVKVWAGDVCDPALVMAALAGCDAVIHLAAIVGYPACQEAFGDAVDTNVGGTTVVCDLLEGRPLLFASTGSTYGKVDGLALESHPVSPLTLYGRTKATGEELVRDAGGVSLRLATLYGLSHRMRWDLLPHDFARAAVKDGVISLYQGGARRTFLHVKDAARAFCEALDAPLQPGEVYNIGRAGGNCTKATVAGLVQAQTGCRVVEAQGSDPDQRDYAVGFGKIREALPRWAMQKGVSMEDALVEVVKWAGVWR